MEDAIFFSLSSTTLVKGAGGVNTEMQRCQPSQLCFLFLSSFRKQTDCQKRPGTMQLHFPLLTGQIASEFMLGIGFCPLSLVKIQDSRVKKKNTKSFPRKLTWN